MDIISGLFALGGVALGALATELRAWRESRNATKQELLALRRAVYVKAVRQMETVSSRAAIWLEKPNSKAEQKAFWRAITDAYETLNELRLTTADVATSEAYKEWLTVYRRVLEEEQTQLPRPAGERERVMTLFRQELSVS